jgi:putative peptidoglycan lipid II flippase
MLAATSGRLYSSAFYALHDTKTPLYFSCLRVLLTAGFAYVSVTQLPGWLGVPRELGAVGITGTTGIAAWIEYALLRHSLNKRIGHTGLGFGTVARLWAAAGLGVACGLAVKVGLVHAFGADPRVLTAWGGHFLPAPRMAAWIAAPLAAIPFGLVYLGATFLLGVPEAKGFVRRLTRRLRPSV